MTQPVNSFNLSGSGTDSDGIITNYQWRQVSGPVGSIIFPDNKALANVSNLIGGTYKFELTITDNQGAIGKDTMELVVALGRMSGQESNSFKVYPNPVIDIATIEINTTILSSNLLIVVTDINGRIFQRKEINTTQYKAIEKVNMSNFANGAYTITVFFNKIDKKTLKIIKL